MSRFDARRLRDTARSAADDDAAREAERPKETIVLRCPCGAVLKREAAYDRCPRCGRPASAAEPLREVRVRD